MQQKARAATKKLVRYCINEKYIAERFINLGEADGARNCWQRATEAVSLCFEEFTQSKVGWVERYTIKSARSTQRAIDAVLDIAKLLNIEWEIPQLFEEIDQWKNRE